MIVKDRVARGDNKYLMKQLNDGTGRIELTPSPDEIIEEGTVLNKSVLQPLFDGLDKIATVETVVNQGKQEIQSATNEAVERLSNAQPESNPKIYTTTELSDPQEGKIYNVKIEENTSTINEKPVYKEGTSESVTLKAGKVATVYYQGGSFFYKANASGDALAEHVLAGKTFSNDDDTDIAGTMVNHGAKIFKPSTANIIIPKGFHDGTGYVEGDPDLVSGNIVQGKNIFGVSGNALTYTQSDKARVANAVTSKGVATSTTASWGQIEQNIRNIKKIASTGEGVFKTFSPTKIITKVYYDSYVSTRPHWIYTCEYNIPVGTILYGKITQRRNSSDSSYEWDGVHFVEYFESGFTSYLPDNIMHGGDSSVTKKCFLGRITSSVQRIRIAVYSSLYAYVFYEP